MEEDHAFLPDNAALLVAHVVDLVEDDPLDFAHDLAAAVEHVPQDFRRHDQARCARVDRHVTGHQTNVAELLVELSVLLVRQRLDRRRVYDTLAVSERHSNSVLGNNGLSG